MKRLLLPAAFLALLFVPIEGIPVAGYVRGIAGDLSITTLLLLASSAVALAGGPKLHDRRELQALAAFVLASAAFLYPMALGLTSFDPYALGYPHRMRGFLLGLAPVALFAWFRGRLLLLLAVVLALAAFRFELLESRNLWDYLLDPWLAVCMLFWAGFTIFGLLSKSR
ncbi:MAG TPA: hypothetical protein VJH87_22805 [Vicinamibacteria bacterium]|nr:hypothetical protein [Vicinamibacteria bacterium]